LTGFAIQVSLNAFKKGFVLHRFLLSHDAYIDAVSMPNVP